MILSDGSRLKTALKAFCEGQNEVKQKPGMLFIRVFFAPFKAFFNFPPFIPIHLLPSLSPACLTWGPLEVVEGEQPPCSAGEAGGGFGGQGRADPSPRPEGGAAPGTPGPPVSLVSSSRREHPDPAAPGVPGAGGGTPGTCPGRADLVGHRPLGAAGPQPWGGSSEGPVSEAADASPAHPRAHSLPQVLGELGFRAQAPAMQTHSMASPGWDHPVQGCQGHGRRAGGRGEPPRRARSGAARAAGEGLQGRRHRQPGHVCAPCSPHTPCSPASPAPFLSRPQHAPRRRDLGSGPAPARGWRFWLRSVTAPVPGSRLFLKRAQPSGPGRLSHREQSQGLGRCPRQVRRPRFHGPQTDRLPFSSRRHGPSFYLTRPRLPAAGRLRPALRRGPPLAWSHGGWPRSWSRAAAAQGKPSPYRWEGLTTHLPPAPAPREPQPDYTRRSELPEALSLYSSRQQCPYAQGAVAGLPQGRGLGTAHTRQHAEDPVLQIRAFTSRGSGTFRPASGSACPSSRRRWPWGRPGAGTRWPRPHRRGRPNSS